MSFLLFIFVLRDHRSLTLSASLRRLPHTHILFFFPCYLLVNISTDIYIYYTNNFPSRFIVIIWSIYTSNFRCIAQYFSSVISLHYFSESLSASGKYLTHMTNQFIHMKAYLSVHHYTNTSTHYLRTHKWYLHKQI